MTADQIFSFGLGTENFNWLTLIGGLCLFLFGMSVMGDGLERRAGNSLKALLGKLTNSKIKGFLTGLGVTAVIQSSSATTVMVVGFVNSRIMTLKQSIGVIMGANIGTTVTAWILSLGGISSDNLFMTFLKPTTFTPILALIGTGLMMFSKSSKKKDVGSILLGFTTLMFGMDTMSAAVSGLANVPAFQNAFLMFNNPILGVLAGMILTAIIQSSSASVGILQALSATGAVSYASAIPIIMGQNIGTCVTALLSSFGTNKNAKRAAVVHLSFNVIGTIICLTVFCLVKAILHPAILDETASYVGIAVAHSAFNVICTAILLPCSSLLEKLAYKIVPDGKDTAQVIDLDDRLLATPTIALAESNKLVCRMAQDAVAGFELSLDLLTSGSYSEETAQKIRKLESDTDRYEDVVGTFLTKISHYQVSDEDGAEISKQLKAIGDYERISDHSVNVLESVEELHGKRIELSDKAKKEMGVLCNALKEILDTTLEAFVNNDMATARKVEPLEQVIDRLRMALRDSHIVRLKNGECTVEAGFIWSDLLTNLERTSDHCSNIAVCVLEGNEQRMNLHESLREIKSGSPLYDKLYDEYAQKYLSEIAKV